MTLGESTNTGRASPGSPAVGTAAQVNFFGFAAIAALVGLFSPGAPA